MTNLRQVKPVSEKCGRAHTDLGTDYRATRSRFARGCTTLLFRLLIRGLPFAIDFGDGDLRPMSDQGAKFHFAPPRFLTLLSILVNPGLRLGETFMAGSWYLTKGSLAGFLLMMVTENRSAKKQHGLTFGLLQAINHYYKQFLTTFTATRKVAKHYDESTRFFELMMDRDLVYTCGFFDETHKNLHDAQQNKFDVIFKRLRLTETAELNILDIGCGWGSFENFFPSDLAANIDGISLSQVQVDHARSTLKTQSENKNLRVNFIKEDYRTFCLRPGKKYNRIVSVGMLEAVGRSKYKHFFQAVENILTDDGIALIHSIVKHQPGATNLWVDRYIFPGGYSPQVSEVVAGIEGAGLKTCAVHFHSGDNYIKTLRAWLKNIEDREGACLDVLVQEQSGGSVEEKQLRARTTFRMYQFFLAALQTMFHREYLGNGVAHFVVTR